VTYLQLFISFFKIGLFGFGGGMSVIALIEMEVTRYGWLTPTEFVDIVGISQVTPGPIGMNCATYVGYTATQSIWGSLVASTALVLPSLIIMLAICTLYMRIKDKWAENRIFQITMRCIRILIVALVAVAAIRLCTPESFIDIYSYVICAIVALCTLLPLFKPADKPLKPAVNKSIDIISHPILLIVAAGFAGWILYI
jgi:chromate transporter